MFLRFKSASAREVFLDRARKEAPQLLDRVRVSKVQPDIVTFNSTMLDEKRRLREVAGSETKVYDDIQFETCEPR
jgi:hypothetical protein